MSCDSRCRDADEHLFNLSVELINNMYALEDDSDDLVYMLKDRLRRDLLMTLSDLYYNLLNGV